MVKLNMLEKKIRVAVLIGGQSAEHAVSLNTGRQVLKKLDPKKYSAHAIKISKAGKWPITFKKLKSDFDIVFNAMHGEYGEDGTVQRLLEKSQIPYTGSRVRASELGMNKIKSLAIFKKIGLNVPPYLIINNINIAVGIKKVSRFGWPVVVKPADRGSSVGLSIVEGDQKLSGAIKTALHYSKTIIIQKYIKGRELTCGVIEKGNRILALPPTEIIPKEREFFDYYSKYTPKATREVTPAKLPGRLTKIIQDLALTAHKSINASDYSRTDMILGNDGLVYVLEINTLPGLTQNSLLPKAAKSIGLKFSSLLDLIIESALKRRYNKVDGKRD